jgi:hypothetical protein
VWRFGAASVKLCLLALFPATAEKKKFFWLDPRAFREKARGTLFFGGNPGFTDQGDSHPQRPSAKTCHVDGRRTDAVHPRFFPPFREST